MTFGLSIETFTLIHVLISLVGLASGLIVLQGFLVNKTLPGWTAVFLATTFAADVTGFGFPFDRLLPSHKLGILSMIVLLVAIAARYGFHRKGAWRWMFVIASVAALHFNVFVAVVQLFEKVPALEALAPTQSEPPFWAAQLVILAVFVALGIFAVKNFRVKGDLTP